MVLGNGVFRLMQQIPLLCIKSLRDKYFVGLSGNVLTSGVCMILGAIALIPGLRQTVNTFWLSIGER